MLRRTSKKTTQRLSLLMMACAIAMPSSAAASSWGVIGSTHLVTSSSLVFVAHVNPEVKFDCSFYLFHTDVRTAAALTVTGASFNCAGRSADVTGCTATVQPTGLPWNITGTTTANITIDGFHADVRFEPKPGTPGECNPTFPSMTLIGRVTNGVWNAAQHQITYINAPGLTATGFDVGGGQSVAPATLTGTLRDLFQTLTLT